MSNRRILVLVVAVLALVTPLATPPVAAQDEEADSWIDDQGCQYDRMDFGATIWSCPDGSSGADWEDGSGNENAASGCSREWSSEGGTVNWFCPDGSSGFDEPDGSGGETTVDDCVRTWDSSRTIISDSCSVPVDDHEEGEPPGSFVDQEGCDVTVADDGQRTWSCPDGSRGGGYRLGSGPGYGVDAQGCSRSWNGGGEMLTDTCAYDAEQLEHIDADGCWIQDYASGFQSRYCPDGSGSFTMPDGKLLQWEGTTTEYPIHTACEFRDSADGNGGNFSCGGGSNAWVSSEGSGYDDVSTGCQGTNYADGSSEIGCMDGSGRTVDADGNVWEWFMNRYDEATGCTTTRYPNRVEFVECDDGSSTSLDSSGLRTDRYYDTERACWVEDVSDGTSSRDCDDGQHWFTNEYGRTIEVFLAPEVVIDEETGCSSQTFDDGTVWKYCGGLIWHTDPVGNTVQFVPPTEQRFDDGSKVVTHSNGTVERWSPDGTLFVEFANGESYEETVDADGKLVRSYPDGSEHVEFEDGSSERTDPWGNTAHTERTDDDDGWITTYADGATQIAYEDGQGSYTELSGFKREETYDPTTGERTVAVSDGTLVLERDDGSFRHVHPDGSEDVGVLDEKGDVVVTRADGWTGVIYLDGTESWTDPYGGVQTTNLQDDGAHIRIWDDGWRESTSADGTVVFRTGPAGESEVSVYGEGGNVDSEFSDGSSRSFNAATGITSFTTASDAVFITHEVGDIEVILDPAGTALEYNELSNTTTLVRADGSTQTTQRTTDGGYLIDLGDGSVLLTDASGSQTVLEGAGHDILVSDDDTRVEMIDGTEMLIAKDDEGLRISYEQVTGCSGDCVGEVQWDKENSEMVRTLDGGSTSSVQVQSDGSLVVESGGEIRTYHPSEGVDGATSVTLNADGSQQIEAEDGGVTQISSDGQTMNVVDAAGISATAVDAEEGIAVVVDGEGYFFPYGNEIDDRESNASTASDGGGNGSSGEVEDDGEEASDGGGNGSSGEVEDDGEEASDETPPTLGLISIEGATVNMSEESRVITITVEAADDMSGIFELCLTWRPEQGPGALDVGKGSCGQGLLDLVAGSPTEGRWQGLLEVPPDFPAQTWSFAGWRLVDGAGNEATGNDGVPDIVLVE